MSDSPFTDQAVIILAALKAEYLKHGTLTPEDEEFLFFCAILMVKYPRMGDTIDILIEFGGREQFLISCRDHAMTPLQKTIGTVMAHKLKGIGKKDLHRIVRFGETFEHENRDTGVQYPDFYVMPAPYQRSQDCHRMTALNCLLDPSLEPYSGFCCHSFYHSFALRETGEHRQVVECTPIKRESYFAAKMDRIAFITEEILGIFDLTHEDEDPDIQGAAQLAVQRYLKMSEFQTHNPERYAEIASAHKLVLAT